MLDISIDYDGILNQLPDNDLEERIKFLLRKLPDEWCYKYREMTQTDANILQFNDGGFEFLFDFSSELVAKADVSLEAAVEDRVIAGFGRSQSILRSRDASRMKGFLGPSTKVFRKHYDKGHFIGHSLGGGLDVNLFPQRRDINRGWSDRGKVFRAMERYCTENSGTFCFSRPIYCDLSWYPCEIEYGLLKQEGVFWIEIFEN